MLVWRVHPSSIGKANTEWRVVGVVDVVDVRDGVAVHGIFSRDDDE